MQPGVLDRDRQPQPAAAAAPGPRLLGPPEPVEHQLGLARAQARRRGRGPAPRPCARRSPARSAPAGPRRGRPRWPPGCARSAPPGAGRPRRTPGSARPAAARSRLSAAIPRTASTARSTTARTSTRSAPEVGHPGVQPADLQQVGQQRLEPVQLGHQQLGAAAQRGQQLGPGGVQHVGGHPHGGQRGAQLVADVGGEPALQRAELLQLADLLLDALRHRVVRLAEPGQLVLAVHRHPLVEVPVGEPLGDLRGLPHRAHHLPGDQAGDAGQQQQQDQPADDQRALHQVERALLGGQREQQVELQVAVRGPHRLADQQRGHLDAVLVQRDVLARAGCPRPPSPAGPAGRPRPGRRPPGCRRRRGPVVSTARNSPAAGEAGPRRPRCCWSAGPARCSARPGRPPGPGRRRTGPAPAATRPASARASVSASLACSTRSAIWVCRISPSTTHHRGGQGQRADHDPHLQRAPPDRAERLGQLAAELAQLRDSAAGPVGERQRGHRPSGTGTPLDHGGPALYPTPRTVSTTSGCSGSRSTLDRSRCTCTFTSRVSAACR